MTESLQEQILEFISASDTPVPSRILDVWFPMGKQVVLAAALLLREGRLVYDSELDTWATPTVASTKQTEN